ncbi:DUF1145 domain-containing protein, partial [Shewanella frigidimarina]|uniref:DUF1145 domain-containing protein n=1 Tax=Shewanella frigidimarina TaxID=56812 RepID=UPI003FA19288
MKVMLILGKIVTAFAWLMMLYNIAFPFEGGIAVALNILFVMTILMHCFQT